MTLLYDDELLISTNQKKIILLLFEYLKFYISNDPAYHNSFFCTALSKKVNEMIQLGVNILIWVEKQTWYEKQEIVVNYHPCIRESLFKFSTPGHELSYAYFLPSDLTDDSIVEIANNIYGLVKHATKNSNESLTTHVDDSTPLSRADAVFSVFIEDITSKLDELIEKFKMEARVVKIGYDFQTPNNIIPLDADPLAIESKDLGLPPYLLNFKFRTPEGPQQVNFIFNEDFLTLSGSSQLYEKTIDHVAQQVISNLLKDF